MKLIIDELTDNTRIDAYLTDYMQNFSRSKVQAEIKKGSVLVNNKPVKPSYCVKEGDEIVFEIPTTTIKIEPENIPLNIVEEKPETIITSFSFFVTGTPLTSPSTFQNTIFGISRP